MIGGSAERKSSLKHGNGEVKRGKEEPMNRTRGFVNLNRFKSGRALKRLKKINDDWHNIRAGVKRKKDK